ncbi:unnamed protein product, partial [Ixodes pacificus]
QSFGSAVCVHDRLVNEIPGVGRQVHKMAIFHYVAATLLLWTAVILHAGGQQTESPSVSVETGATTLGASTVSPTPVVPPGTRRPSWVTSTDAGCRKRVVCEAARTLTYVFPLTQYWQSVVRDRPATKDDYFGAWSRGLLDEDCSNRYPDCSDSPAGVVLPAVNQVVGPKGFVGSFLDRLVRPSAANVARDPGYGRPSIVMQRIRLSEYDFSRRQSNMSSAHAYT